VIVVSMTNCPPKLRGDLSKWLMEINTGVYVGQVNARVRDALWKRICDNIGDGQATMVFSANNEQHLDFYVHNTSWRPVELDGIRLMKRPDRTMNRSGETPGTGFSNAAKRRMGSRRRKNDQLSSYVVLDLETTGISPEKDQIIEVGAVEVKNGEVCGEYEALVKCSVAVPAQISELTGITDAMLAEQGRDPHEVLTGLFGFISGKTVLIYNASFDLRFLEISAGRHDIELPEMEIRDVLKMARARIRSLENFKLETVAGALELGAGQTHRAIDDCRLLVQVFSKLNEI